MVKTAVFGSDENNGFELANILQSKGSTHGPQNVIFETNGGTKMSGFIEEFPAEE